MRAQLIKEYTTECQVSCGKRGCILFYKGDQCAFCEPAITILRDSLQQYGISEEIIHEVDVGTVEEIAVEEGIVGLPTLEICNERIVGLPQEGTVRDAVLKAIMQDCFCDQ